MAKGTVTVALLSLLLGGLLGYAAGQVLSPASTPTLVAAAEGTGLPERLARVEAERVRLATENQRLRESAARLPLPPAAPPPATAPSASPQAGAGAYYTNGEYKRILDSVDWKVVGDSTLAMRGLLDKLHALIAKGEEPSLELRLKIREVNEKILQEALKTVKGKIPGAGVNGTFTHPLVAANHLRATLAAAGVDLGPEQGACLRHLSDLFTLRDSMLPRDEGETPGVAQLVAEWELRRDYFDQVEALLTPEQRARILNPQTRGRVGIDFFGHGMAMVEFARPLPVKDASDLAGEFQGYFRRYTELGPEQLKQVNRIVKEWVGRLPKAFWDRRPDGVDRRFMRDRAVMDAARRQAELFREILDRVRPDPAAVKALFQSRRIFVPQPR